MTAFIAPRPKHWWQRYDFETGYIVPRFTLQWWPFVLEVLWFRFAFGHGWVEQPGNGYYGWSLKCGQWFVAWVPKRQAWKFNRHRYGLCVGDDRGCWR